MLDEQTTQAIRKKTGEGKKDTWRVSEQDSRSSHSPLTICIYLKHQHDLKGKRRRQSLSVRQSSVQLRMQLSASCASWPIYLISCSLSILFCALDTMVPASGDDVRMKWENISQVFGMTYHIVSTPCLEVLLLRQKQLNSELRL